MNRISLNLKGIIFAYLDIIKIIELVNNSKQYIEILNVKAHTNLLNC